MLKFALALPALLFASVAWPQATAPAAAPTAPPKVLLLVYQQFLPGKASQRQTLEIDIARNFDRLGVPILWIELESMTGPPQALFVDPANSFAEIDKAGVVLAQLYGTHPDLAQSQRLIEDLIANSRTVTAELRDDLSLNTGTINLAKARYLRIRTVQVHPEREHDFINSITLNRGPGQAHANGAWVAYQVNAGLPDLTFLFLEALHSMQDVDQFSTTGGGLTPFGAWLSSEANLYAIHPEMSHVSKDFAAADPAFWGAAPRP